MDYTYKFNHAKWDRWPLVDGLKYPHGDQNNFINYEVSCIKPELIVEMKRIGLTPDSVNVFYTCPGKFVPIHVDGFNGSAAKEESRRRNRAAVNWAYTDFAWKMTWYEEPTDPKAVFEHNSNFQLSNLTAAKPANYSYTRYVPEYMVATHEESWEELSPMLIRTNIPHNVTMLETGPRWCASIRFTTDDFDYLKNVLSQHYSG
jgi:hypothetical protein